MDILLILVCTAIVVSLVSIVFISKRSQAYAIWFMLMCLALVTWVISNYFTNHYYGSEQLVQVSNLIAYISGLLAFYFGTMFSYKFPIERKDSWSEQQSGTFATMAVAVLSFSPVVSGEPRVINGEIIYTVGNGLWLYLMMMLVLLTVTTRNLYQARTNKNKHAHTQLNIVLFAVLVSGLFGLLVNVVVPGLGFGWDSTRAAPLSVIIFTCLVAYSMLRHQLFNVRFAAVRTAGYALSLISLGAVYFFLAYFLSVLLFGRLNIPVSLVAPLNIGLALILAALFQPVRSFFDRLSDKIFYHSQYNTDDFITKLGDALTSTVNLRSMLERASNVMTDTLRASSVSFVIHREGRADLVITSGRKATLARDDMKDVRGYIAEGNEPVIDVAEAITFDDSKIIHHLFKRHYSLIIPLGEGLGFVLIRERLGGSYSERDKRVLAAVSDELAIAIQNARSVEGLRELNTSLQQRIDAATKELRLSNQRLKKLDEVKDEFVSMASHQLRTPLTSVKGYISMVLEGDVGKITPQQEKLLGEAFISSERMVRLIGDFLNVSRLQTGKFMIDAKPVDLARVVDEEIESIRTLAQSHGQQIIYHAPSAPLEVMIDEDKTRQVIMNFIDNAIFYSPDTKAITIKLHSAKNQVVFEVHDKGIGVPKSKQEQLFTKFFRAENARKQRPDGTGIGLYLAKKVIEAQDGEIIFHSRPGMGSVFGFKLPIGK